MKILQCQNYFLGSWPAIDTVTNLMQVPFVRASLEASLCTDRRDPANYQKS